MTLYPRAEAFIPWQGSAVYAGNDPRYIVIHVAQGWMRTWDDWAREGYADASFHFGVGLGGAVHQYLEEHQGGAHAGGPRATLHPVLRPYTSNLLTLGIEHEGFSSGIGPVGPVPQWNDKQLGASAALVRWQCAKNGIPRTREFILGHHEIATDRAQDPGPLFPWGRYMQMVQEDDMTEDEVRAIVREEIEKVWKAAGAGYVPFVKAMTARLKAIHKATDLESVPE